MLPANFKKESVRRHFDKLADQRDEWIRKSRYYYQDLFKFFSFNILPGASVLEIGCGTGELLNALKPGKGVGIDLSTEMIRHAQARFPHLEFLVMDAENMTLEGTFDYVVLSDTLGYFGDIQFVFRQIRKLLTADSRIILSYHNFLWNPLLQIAEALGAKMPQQRLNWLNRNDIENLLFLEGYDIIKSGKRFLCPVKIPLVSSILNRCLCFLPILNRLCLTGYIVARPFINIREPDHTSVSIIIPARNEKGNIEDAVRRIPCLGGRTEIIFVEGHSKDGTPDEIRRVQEKYAGRRNIRYAVQDHIGKGDAVRKGFSMAEGDILMILDADLTVPPEDLPKFYEAICSGRGEFINGSRLVYPLEEKSMRTLNLIGNKFFSLMFTWLLGQRLKDTLCGTKVISRSNYEKLIANRHYFGDFDPFGDFDLIFGAAKMNLKIVEIPIHYQSRQYGDTQISRFRHGWLLMKMVAFAMDKIKFV